MAEPEMRQADAEEAETARILVVARGGWAGNWNPNDVLIATHPEDGSIVATARETTAGPKNVRILASVWVKPELRGRRLGLRLTKLLMEKSSAEILWLDCRPELILYYSSIGFRLDDKAALTPFYLDDSDPPDQVAMSFRKRPTAAAE